MEKPKTRRDWRKLVKKLQRKVRRQKIAKELEKKERKKTLDRLNDPNYQYWLQQQFELERFQKLAEERQHNEEEEAWLRRELVAQRKFHLEEESRKAKEAVDEALRMEEHKKLEERESAQKKRREERERLQAEAASEFERVMEKIQFYLSNEDSQTPTELKLIIETRPGEKLCEFHDRTNCCRFGLGCIFNHRRPILASILLIHHFFMHPLLEENEHREYAAADSHLESNERDLRADYDEFFDDACAELEAFGTIRNFRTVRNVLPHLRGNVFVEYENKRSAIKAFTALQGRYYAKRRLIVEYSNIKRWRGAICGTSMCELKMAIPSAAKFQLFKGLSLSRNCARGLKCGYLHLFQNPGNKYNTVLENLKTPVSELSHNIRTPQSDTPSLRWDDLSPDVPKRNWRWSESPEPVARTETGSSPLKKHDSLKNSSSDRERRKRNPFREKSERF